MLIPRQLAAGQFIFFSNSIDDDTQAGYSVDSSIFTLIQAIFEIELS